MGKVLKTVATVASVIALAATGAGAIVGAGTLIAGASLGTIAAAAGATSVVAGSLAGTGSGPKIPQSDAQLSRLQARLDTQAPRKLIVGGAEEDGYTAFPADIRYYEGSGEDERVIEYIIAVAAHKVRRIDSLYIEDELAWTAVGGVTSQFVDHLGVEGYTEGKADNTRAINGGARWGSDDRLTGCAYLYVRVNRLGASENEQSPFANGLPGRVTIVGEGMPMYDPRFDSTRGGSGSMRVDNHNSWGPSSGNPIIQSLNVLLGWRINGKLSVGAGIPAKYINFDSVITAANACDEDIVLSGGGTQPRYRTAGAFSTDDAPMNIVGALLAGCAGDLLDSDGQLSFLIKTNTLAVPAVTFDDHDILSAGRWDPMGGQTNLPNIISGNFTDPSDRSLYQPVPYPSVRLDSEDGIERTAPVDLPVVENAPQAERLAKQTLQRMQYPGLFSAEYNMKGMAAKVGSIVWQSYSPRGWLSKPFRVVSQKPSRSGRIALVLREEHEDIYAWEAEDSAAVQPAEPVRFDFRNTGPILLAREAAKVADWPRVTDSEGTKPEDNATFGSPDGSPVGDRLAEDITGALDEAAVALANLATTNAEISEEVDAAQAGIQDLIDTYGSTAAAAASAANAQTSEINAGIAATAAGGHATTADGSATAAAAASNLSAKYAATAAPPSSIDARLYSSFGSSGEQGPGVPVALPDFTGPISNDADGTYALLLSQWDYFFTKHVLPVTPGVSVVEVVARLKANNTPNPTARQVIYWLDKDFNWVASSHLASDFTVSGSLSSYNGRAACPADSRIAYARVSSRITSSSTAGLRVYGTFGRDVTVLDAGEAQAAIATAQAAIATAEASAASSSSTLSARWAEAAAQKNFCIDPDGNNNAYAWDSGVETVNDRPSVAPSSDRSLRIVGDTASQRSTSYKYNPQGRTFRVRCWIKPVNTGGGFSFCLRQSDGSYIQNFGPTISAASTSWTYIEHVHTCTASANSWTVATDLNNSGPRPSDIRIWGLVWEDITDVVAVEASVQDIRGAAANSSGQVAAFIRQIVAASGGNPAMFELLAGAGGSKIGLVADQIALGNSVNGIIETVLKIENGQAVLSDAVIRRLRVAPRLGSAILHDVALRPKEFLAADGNVVQYEGGSSYGALPEKIVPSLSGLPALAAGESYDVRAVSISATQFTARAKKLSAGTLTERSGSTRVDGGSAVPKWRVNKPTSQDAYDGQYEFKWFASIRKIEESPEGGGMYIARYSGSFDLYIYNGSSWIKVGSYVANFSRTSFSGPNPAVWGVVCTRVINSEVSSPSGAQIFGVHPTTDQPTITEFTSVKYTSQSSGTASPVSGLIKWEVFPPRD